MPSTSIAFLGSPGSFSHSAALRNFGESSPTVACGSFSEIFDRVIRGEAELGILPIENSLAGSIQETYDLLTRNQLHIIDEVILRIEHHLCMYATEGADTAQLDSIRRVYSHPKALEQCANFLSKLPHAERFACSDTATAAKKVAELNDSTCAAICSSDAAKRYGLTIIKNSIEDNAQNFTRFIVVSPQSTVKLVANKCALLFRLPHKPQALLTALSSIASDQINITRIESRPIPGSPFEYSFYIDFEFNPEYRAHAQERVSLLSQSVLSCKILGWFPKARE